MGQRVSDDRVAGTVKAKAEMTFKERMDNFRRLCQEFRAVESKVEKDLYEELQKQEAEAAPPPPQEEDVTKGGEVKPRWLDKGRLSVPITCPCGESSHYYISGNKCFYQLL